VCDAVFQILSSELSKVFSLPVAPRNRWATRDSAAQPSSSSTAPGANPPSAEPPRSAPPLAPEDERPSYVALRQAGAGEYVRSAQTSSGVPPAQQSTLLFTRDVDGDTAAPLPEFGPMARRLDDDASIAWSRLRYVAQVHGTYLVCESDAGLYLLDQHAAAERVTFDRLKKQYTARSTPSQALLFPVLSSLDAHEVEFVEANAAEFERMGFDVQARSPTSVSIHQVPRLLQNADPERLLRDLLLELTRTGREFSSAVDLALATLACHGSLRAGQSINPQEARALLDALDDVDFAGHCPHGRPVVSFTPWIELERKVGRR
jgi:DNA mismatch repair protein MutL